MMAKTLGRELSEAARRFRKGQQYEGQSQEEFEEREKAKQRIFADSSDPNFARRRNMCGGSRRYLGVKCPGCKKCLDNVRGT
jgi:hypothetical protein